MSQDAAAKRFLVTGCAGFIAAQVCRQLCQAGHEVLGVDNLNAAYDPRLKQWRLDALAREPGFQFQRVDVADRAAVAALFAAARSAGRDFTAALHLAARAGVRPSVEDPWTYYDSNLTGTLNVLEACRTHGIRKFVLSSTSSAYGEGAAPPFREDAAIGRPLSPYAASKIAAEVLAYTYHHLHALDVTVLRYFTVYGPAGRPDMSILRFVRQMSEGEVITVHGDGSQSRDFTYVDDVARGTVAALRPLGYEIVNLGGDSPESLLAVIDAISRLVGQPPRIDFVPRHAADVSTTWADIQKARRLLDWSPQTTLADGLARTVAWYREHRDFVRGLEF